jgi:serine/threonine protein kinase
MEYAAGGELFSRLHNTKGIFGCNTSKFYLCEILLAIEHVQSHGYAYRDLKPENIMLDEEGHCKLIDFGFAARPDKDGLLHTNVGTPAYLSPEQLNHKKTGGYKPYVDYWSFAILM